MVKQNWKCEEKNRIREDGSLFTGDYDDYLEGKEIKKVENVDNNLVITLDGDSSEIKYLLTTCGEIQFKKIVNIIGGVYTLQELEESHHNNSLIEMLFECFKKENVEE